MAAEIGAASLLIWGVTVPIGTVQCLSLAELAGRFPAKVEGAPAYIHEGFIVAVVALRGGGVLGPPGGLDPRCGGEPDAGRDLSPGDLLPTDQHPRAEFARVAPRRLVLRRDGGLRPPAAADHPGRTPLLRGAVASGKPRPAAAARAFLAGARHLGAPGEMGLRRSLVGVWRGDGDRRGRRTPRSTTRGARRGRGGFGGDRPGLRPGAARVARDHRHRGAGAGSLRRVPRRRRGLRRGGWAVGTMREASNAPGVVGRPGAALCPPCVVLSRQHRPCHTVGPCCRAADLPPRAARRILIACTYIRRAPIGDEEERIWCCIGWHNRSRRSLAVAGH